MLETSLDVLYITLAVSIGVLTVFLCWGIYYAVRILRNAVFVVEKFTKVLHKADEVLDLAKDKLHSGGTYLALFVNAVQTAAQYLGEKKDKKKK